MANDPHHRKLRSILTDPTQGRRLLRHVLPNALGVIIVALTMTIPSIVMYEAFLSFLGLGIQEPRTSLGKLVNDGTVAMESASWMLLMPATLLAVVLLCFNFLGDGLRDVFDSRRSQ